VQRHHGTGLIPGLSHGSSSPRPGNPSFIQIAYSIKKPEDDRDDLQFHREVHVEGEIEEEIIGRANGNMTMSSASGIFAGGDGRCAITQKSLPIGWQVREN
jgi:hypothetical protein